MNNSVNLADLQEAQERKATLWNRIKELRAKKKETTDRSEIGKLDGRIRVLHAMYKDACADERRLNPEKKNSKYGIHKDKDKGSNFQVVLETGAVFADLEGVSWNLLGNYTWGGTKRENENEKSRAARQTQYLIQEGLRRCTPKQQEYIKEYYSMDTTCEEMGRKRNINKSTISVVIRRGLNTISDYINAKLLIHRFVDKDGYFDYLGFAANINILTERHREILFFLMSERTTYQEIGCFIDRNISTVSRDVRRLTNRLDGIAVDIDIDRSSIKINKKMWKHLSEKELAEMLGLSHRFYYTIACRDKKINGIPYYHIYLLRFICSNRDKTLAECARIAGASPATVYRINKLYDINTFDPWAYKLPEYNPRKIEKVKQYSNPYVAICNGAMIDSIISTDKEKRLIGGN